MEWTPEMTEAALAGVACREAGHPPNPIQVGGPGPLPSTCDCGTYEWVPRRTTPRFPRTAPKE